MKNNFTQALKELTGFDNQSASPKSQSGGESADFSFDGSASYAESDTDSVTTMREFAESGAQGEQEAVGTTRITSTMVITGDVKSGDNVFINGQLIGNLKTTANLNATSLIMGDVQAAGASLSGARIKGNVTLSDNFLVGENSVVVGDVKCAGARIAGKIKGNCHIDGTADLTSSALLIGDVTAVDISTEQGAKIVGLISTGAEDINVDEEFDFGGDL